MTAPYDAAYDLTLDLGATNVRWTLFPVDLRHVGRAPHDPAGVVYTAKSRDFADFPSLVEALLAEAHQRITTAGCRRRATAHRSAAAGAIRAVGAAIPGPVCTASRAGPTSDAAAQDTARRNHTARFTNLPWPEVDEQRLRARFGIPIRLINDLAAMAHAIDAAEGPERSPSAPTTPTTLAHARWRPLAGSGPIRRDEPILVVGLGTGFGCALRVPVGDHVAIVPGEGGHARLAGPCPGQTPVRREDWLSGPGLPRFAEAHLGADVTARMYRATSSEPTSGASPRGPDAATLVAAARAGDRVANTVLDAWTTILGGALADLALGAVPTGGVVLGGGVTRHLADWLDRPRLRDAFSDRAPMTDLLRRIPLARLDGHEPVLPGLRLWLARTFGPNHPAAG